MAIKIFQVDAFTGDPFKGNPAAVCILKKPANEKWMQDFAREMNLSETAFLVANGNTFDLRWFTPTTEVDLCGHATLASAHALWQAGVLPTDQTARFNTKSGRLTASLCGEWIELNFPVNTVAPIQQPKGLTEALAVDADFIGSDGTDYLVEVSCEKIITDLKPDLKALKTFPVRCIVVTSLSDSKEYDFVSRVFAPGAGIDEDPVTGSAHCSLGPFWATRLNKQEMLAYQASSRGGFVRVTLKGDRVLLGGQAVTIFQGTLT